MKRRPLTGRGWGCLLSGVLLMLAANIVSARPLLYLGVLLVALQLTGWSPTKPGLVRYDQAFTRDDIADLINWMRTELPRDATVVAAKSLFGR